MNREAMHSASLAEYRHFPVYRVPKLIFRFALE